MIADIINSEAFDIVALQEVRDYRAVELLKRFVGKQYWKSYCDISNSREPEFAFLWNVNTIDLYRDNDDEHVMPRFINEYSGGFKRVPYYGRFTPKAAPKELSNNGLVRHL